MSEEKSPLVSVGMTTYNRPEYLKLALDGILNQTYRNLEIIISEDCSPCEKTKALLREYEQKDDRIRYFSQKVNLGPPANLQFVLQQATGEYFMWADDDDVRDKQWIEVLLRRMAVEDTIAAIGTVVSMDAEGNPIRQYQSLQFSGARPIRLARYFLAEESEGKANIVCGLFDTSSLRSIKHWREYNKKYYGVDYLFVLDCLQYGNVMVDPSVSVYKRVTVGKDMPAVSLSDYTQRAYRRLQYYLVCIGVANHWFDKLLLSLLLPVKLIKAISYKISMRFK